MSLFLHKDKTPKSPLVMLCFCMGFVFCTIFGVLYALLTKPLYNLIHIGNEALSAGIHSALIALLGTALCCIFFLLRDKRIVPGTFAVLGVFLAAGCLMTLSLDADRRQTMLLVLLLYGLAPVLLGNIISWGIYWKTYTKRHAS